MSKQEFPGGPVVKGSGIVTAMAQVAAVVPVGSLAWELLHTVGAAKKKKKDVYHLIPELKLTKRQKQPTH